MSTSPSSLASTSTAYDPKTIEADLYARWESQKLFSPDVVQTLRAQSANEVPMASEHFQNNTQSPDKAFSLVIPPPNVTGVLHMGHALDNTLQDILIRWHRMQGTPTVWIPGTDHAGIATQTVVERQLQAEGKTRDDLGRQAFLEKVHAFAAQSKKSILGQLRRLGVSPDWTREAFTLDESRVQSVRQAFVTLYERGLIERGDYIVNWCPKSASAISDIEVEYREEAGFLYHIRYVADDNPDEALIVATTRPETLFGDVAVAVNPKDERLNHWIGRRVRLPLTCDTIPVIGDEYVDIAFGTGALKITPAHDKNDFEVGRRHGLPAPIILDLKGHLADHARVPSDLRGVERFQARKQCEALLEASGLLVQKEAHTHRVGYSQRHGSVIEPLLSKQWFVKTKPLAERALKSLQAGELKFIPERWEADYTRWLENIQPWCVSRQLWWGHAIPAWYAIDDEKREFPIVALEKPEKCPKTGSTELVQDPDVLDTWFSSGLWPFSTMGWPNENSEDFKKYYPTSVLVTGFDIIFFWVARMTMMGLALTGKSPFHTVYIHGLIRDEKGQKMSKSKGNTVDPVLAIDQYGCDGFRFGLTSLVTYGGQDIKLAPDKLEQGKLFANKLWNAARFVMMNLSQGDMAPSLSFDTLTPMDQWILAKYRKAAEAAQDNLEAFRFGEYAIDAQRFVWDDFCDWYVEMAKAQLKDPTTEAMTRRVLFTVLDGALRLLHPVMPFISESLWLELQGDKPAYPSISMAKFPNAQQMSAPLVDPAGIDFVLETVRALRNLRQSYKVPHSSAVSIIIDAPDLHQREALEANLPLLHRFIKMSDLSIQAQLSKKPSQAAVSVVGQCQIFLPLAELIDLGQERTRLSKQLEKLQSDYNQLEKLLHNAGFMSKATEEVIAAKREQLIELSAQTAHLSQQLAALSAVP
ncbi:MAG: valine--tRNA ligase [Vampirovibrionales bacterium]|nr:valine--tRNA ligase [Vampirovibrionales bacterium]